MSDKPRTPHADALRLANELVARLTPHVERIAIAGSVRRLKPFVGDVELLFVPKLADVADGLFDTVKESVTDHAIDAMLADGALAKRPSKTGQFAWGALNKLAVHSATGIGVDLFCEPCAGDWWRSLVIRTGPKEMNLRLIDSAAKRKVRVHAYGHGLTDFGGSSIPCASEEEFFAICGVAYLPPDKR